MPSALKRPELGLAARVYSDFDAALRSAEVDVVDICLPTPVHPIHIRKGLAAENASSAKSRLPQPRPRRKKSAAAADRAGVEDADWPLHSILARVPGAGTLL
jgi:hypothetical protein